MEKEIKNTTDFLTQDDLYLLNKIELIRFHFDKHIDKQLLVDKMKELIKESKYFSFKAERNSRYISKTRPIFILKLDMGLASKDHGYNFLYTDQSIVLNTEESIKPYISDFDFINKLLVNEVTKDCSAYLSELINDNDVIKDVFKKNDIDIDDNDMALVKALSFLTATVFGISIELQTNIITIEMLV